MVEVREARSFSSYETELEIYFVRLRALCSGTSRLNFSFNECRYIWRAGARRAWYTGLLSDGPDTKSLFSIHKRVANVATPNFAKPLRFHFYLMWFNGQCRRPLDG